MSLLLRIGIYQFLPQVKKKKMQLFLQLLLLQGVLVELVERQRNTLWDWVINWWKVVWRQEMRPRYVYMS